VEKPVAPVVFSGRAFHSDNSYPWFHRQHRRNIHISAKSGNLIAGRGFRLHNLAYNLTINPLNR
jgi:hypothetical protein